MQGIIPSVPFDLARDNIVRAEDESLGIRIALPGASCLPKGSEIKTI